MRKTSVVILVICLVLLAAVGVLFLPGQTVEITASAKHSFVIDQRMERVRKILVRTNAVKTIVAMADAELTGQEWLDLDFENEGSLLDRDWNLSGKGRLQVRSNDSYLGAQDLTLEQDINIQPEKLVSVNNLVDPADSIREYQAELVLTPDSGGNASFETSLEITIRTEVSWLTRSRVESGIRQSPTRALIEMEQAIRQVVESHAADLIILPDRK